MLQKLLVLAGIPVVASAMCFPAVTAANWTDSTVAVGSNAPIATTGTLGFVGGFGGILCDEASGEGFIEPGTTGTVTSNKIVSASCTSSGGLGGCKVTTTAPTGLPWAVHNTTSTVTTTGVNVDMTLHGAFCPYHEIGLKGSTTLTPSNSHAAGAGTIGGTVGAYNGTTGALIQNVTGSGEGSITPSGTYGLT